MMDKVTYKMDYAEERKLFDAEQQRKGYGYITDLNTLAFAFQMWIAAKVNAMPVAEIGKRETHVGSAWVNFADHDMGHRMHDTKLEAELEAMNKGYRLV